MGHDDAAELVHRLGRQAEAVCRAYLSNGRREGRYWIVGDVHNTPGRSMFVRLKDSSKGPAGKWTDAATGAHGDLIDVIRESRGFFGFREAAEEARRFLSLPPPEPAHTDRGVKPAPTGSPESSRRLFAMSLPIAGTLAAVYLRRRGITAVHALPALRFHPRCYFRPQDDAPTQTWPALVASVTDLADVQTGAHRTWLARDGSDKAPIIPPRKAMGDLLGHAARFGRAADVLAAGEGIETVLSVREVLPGLPAAAALSANHLAAILFPPTLRRLYILRDRGAAGDMTETVLTERAAAAGIEAVTLAPALGDFNEDLCDFGAGALRARFRHQLVAEDIARFSPAEGPPGRA